MLWDGGYGTTLLLECPQPKTSSPRISHLPQSMQQTWTIPKHDGPNHLVLSSPRIRAHGCGRRRRVLSFGTRTMTRTSRCVRSAYCSGTPSSHQPWLNTPAKARARVRKDDQMATVFCAISLHCAAACDTLGFMAVASLSTAFHESFVRRWNPTPWTILQHSGLDHLGVLV